MESAAFAHSLQGWIGFGPLWVWAALAAFAIVFLVVLPLGGMATYAERKVAADIQDRIGPNRVGPLGLLQFLADGVKMISKQDFVPPGGDRFLYALGPILVVGGTISAFAAIPFSQYLVGGDVNIGIFYIFAVTTLIPAGLLLGSWSSANKWSLLGGMRAAAQIVSYEIPVSLCIMPVILISGTLQVGQIVQQQGWAWSSELVSQNHFWNVFHNPFTFISFFLLIVAGLAETNRIPFDLPEAESELVSGFNTEFSGMRFGLYALGEFVEVFVMAGIAVTLYLGGWHIPFVNLENLWVKLPTGLIAIIQFHVFMIKLLLIVFVVMWVRWTLPRLRVDQLMSFCWKGLVPLALINVLGTIVWMILFKGQSILQMLYQVSSGGH